MRKFVSFGALALLMATTAISLVSCEDDDVTYGDTTAPEVEESYSVSGLVTTLSGEGISGATVTLGSTSASTGSDGTFLFEDVEVGTYTITASATGKISKSGEVTVSSSATHPVWTVALSNEGVEITINTDGSASDEAESEVIEGNDQGIVTVTFEAEEDAIEAEEGATVTMTQIYSEDDVENVTRAAARAASDMMLIGTSITCSDSNATINSPISLSYDIDSDFIDQITAQKYVDGAWQNVGFTQDSQGRVVIAADEFTTYSIVCSVDVESETSTSTVYDWEYESGNSETSIDSFSYSYNVGGTITTSASNKVTAYLVELLARITGSTYVKSTVTYSLNITLPVSAGLTVNATQTVYNYTISSNSYQATGKQYGDVTVNVSTYTRTHTGGSN